MNEEKIDEGIFLTPDEEFWMKKMKDIAAGSIKSIEEAGKHIIGIITVMQGIYAAVLAFSGIKEIPEANLPAAVFYVSPILLWLVSLFFVLRVFKTKKYNYYSNSPGSAKETFIEISAYKQKNLNVSYFFLCLSFVIAVLGILYWLYIGTTPSPTI